MKSTEYVENFNPSALKHLILIHSVIILDHITILEIYMVALNKWKIDKTYLLSINKKKNQ